MGFIVILNIFVPVLTRYSSCSLYFAYTQNFQGTCFGHAFSKACQYGTTKEKVYRNLKYVSIKSTQVDLQKCITWPKKYGKGKQEWNKVCLETKIRPKKLNIPIKTR
jgi:hypothetical protein